MMQKWVVRRSGRFRTTSGQTNADRSYCRDVPIARVALAGMCECVGARVRSVVKGWAAPRGCAGKAVRPMSAVAWAGRGVLVMSVVLRGVGARRGGRLVMGFHKDDRKTGTRWSWPGE